MTSVSNGNPDLMGLLPIPVGDSATTIKFAPWEPNPWITRLRELIIRLERDPGDRASEINLLEMVEGMHNLVRRVERLEQEMFYPGDPDD